jgi:CubicO group peptidase (beta-lactamase class C family)
MARVRSPIRNLAGSFRLSAAALLGGYGLVGSACGSSTDDTAVSGGHTSTTGGAAQTSGGSSQAGRANTTGGHVTSEGGAGGEVSATGAQSGAATDPGAGAGGEASSLGSAAGAESGGTAAAGVGGAASVGTAAAGAAGAESGGAFGDAGLITEGTASEDAACEQKLRSDWAAHPPAVGFGSTASLQSYDQVIGGLMASYGVPGGAVAVTYEGRLVLARAYGFADTASHQPAHPANLFRVASLSKQLTAIAVLKLVEAGTLALDTPAFSLLPNLAPLPGKTKNAALASITIRDLLNHTGGWNRNHEAVGDPMFASLAIANALGEAGPASADDTIRYMMDKPLSYAPGSTYCYSNLGYAILGSIIEAVTGKDYEAFVKDNVLAPAGVSDTLVGGDLQGDAREEEVTYYDYPGAPLTTSIFPGAPSPAPWPYGGFSMQAMKAHGGWIASPIDFLRVARGVDIYAPEAALLSSASLTAMLANPNVASCNDDGTTTPASSAYWYGFGYQVNQYGNYWHTGSLPGTATENVIARNKYNFAAFFNTRPAGGDFFGELDNDLWTAFDGVSGFSDQDYFDQYATYSGWLSPIAFANRVRAQSDANRYPSRAEGRIQAGELQFRAAFGPVHPGVMTDSRSGLDCAAYVALAERNASAGLGLASLQTFVDEDGLTRYQATWAGE